MDIIARLDWHPRLSDPTGARIRKPRQYGKTMVIDKGIGLHAFEDMLLSAGEHIDTIKLGFGTSALYPQQVLRKKIALARAYQVEIMPGGTFLEAALCQNVVNDYFDMIEDLGFTCVEVSDGTIELSRTLRSELIRRCVELGFQVYAEYGKKISGSTVDIEELVQTVQEDLLCGASLVTIEGRESGIDVGIYDENGKCREEDFQRIIDALPNQQMLMWEAPQKSQQVYIMQKLGCNVNLGNIAPDDILSVESLRRGLRSDTLAGLGQ